MAPGVVIVSGVSLKEETGQGTPSLIRGGFERSSWQQKPARCCAVRERFTLLFDR
jgi:hypothetical protein